MKGAILFSILVFNAPSAIACEIPTGWVTMSAQSNAPFTVAAKLPELPIKTTEQFGIDILVCEKTSDVRQMILDANMPAHQHGMNYLAEVAKTGNDIYRGTGLFFHMPGQWQITLEIKADQTHRFYLDVAAQ